jgi:hypothetical protein
MYRVNDKIDIRKFLALVFIVTALSSINWFLPKLIYNLPIPIISTGIPSRIFVLSTFSISILAGFGIDSFKKSLANKKSMYLLLGISFLFLLILSTSFVLFKTGAKCPPPDVVKTCWNIAVRNTLLEGGVYSLFAIIFVLHFIKRKTSSLFLFFPLVLFSVSAIYNAGKFIPFSMRSSFFPEIELIKSIKSITSFDRVIGFGEANIATDIATYFKFYDPNYYQPLYIKRYGELVSYSNLGDTGSGLLRSDVNIEKSATLSSDLELKRTRLLKLLSVKYIIYKKSETEKRDKSVYWENKHWYIINNTSLPRAYIVNSYTVKRDEEILKTLFDTNFQPENQVVIEKDINLPDKKLIDSKAKIITDMGGIISINTQTQSDSILVLTDNYYPGWKASVDGKDTEIYRANYTFRAIKLPAGKHNVKFIFDPISFRLGLIISLASAGILLILFLRGVTRKI